MIIPSIHSSVRCLIELPSNIKALVIFLGHVINVSLHDSFALSLNFSVWLQPVKASNDFPIITSRF